MLKHIIWDWNGTLLNDMPLALHVMNEMLTRRGMNSLSQETYLARFDHPVQEFYRGLGFNLLEEPFEVISREFGEGYIDAWDSCALHAGARTTLEFFRTQGLSQSVLSASHRGVLERNVDYFGLRKYFKDLSALDDHLAHSKVEQGLRWLEFSGLAPTELLLIGDTTHDFEVAQALKCQSILVASGHQSRQRLELCGTRVVDSLDELYTHQTLLKSLSTTRNEEQRTNNETQREEQS